MLLWTIFKCSEVSLGAFFYCHSKFTLCPIVNTKLIYIYESTYIECTQYSTIKQIASGRSFELKRNPFWCFYIRGSNTTDPYTGINTIVYFIIAINTGLFNKFLIPSLFANFVNNARAYSNVVFLTLIFRSLLIFIFKYKRIAVYENWIV